MPGLPITHARMTRPPDGKAGHLSGRRAARVPAAGKAGGGVHNGDHRSRGGAHRGRNRDRRWRSRGPRLRDQADAAARERARADREAGRGSRGGGREGQDDRGAPALRRQHEALGDAGALPRPGAVGVARLPGGDQGRGLLPHLEDGGSAQADAAELPQPRQLRHLDREAGPLPRREGRGGGRLRPQRNRGRQAAGRGPDRSRRPLRRQGPRQGWGGALQLRAGLGPRGQGHGPRGGDARAPDRRRARLLRSPGP